MSVNNMHKATKTAINKIKLRKKYLSEQQKKMLIMLNAKSQSGELTDYHIAKIIDCLSDFDRDLYPGYDDFYSAITPLLIEIDRPFKQIMDKALELGLRYKDNYGVMSPFFYSEIDDKEYSIKNA